MRSETNAGVNSRESARRANVTPQTRRSHATHVFGGRHGSRGRHGRDPGRCRAVRNCGRSLGRRPTGGHGPDRRRDRARHGRATTDGHPRRLREDGTPSAERLVSDDVAEVGLLLLPPGRDHRFVRSPPLHLAAADRQGVARTQTGPSRDLRIPLVVPDDRQQVRRPGADHAAAVPSPAPQRPRPPLRDLARRVDRAPGDPRGHGRTVRRRPPAQQGRSVVDPRGGQQCGRVALLARRASISGEGGGEERHGLIRRRRPLPRHGTALLRGAASHPRRSRRPLARAARRRSVLTRRRGGTQPRRLHRLRRADLILGRGSPTARRAAGRRDAIADQARVPGRPREGRRPAHRRRRWRCTGSLPGSAVHALAGSRAAGKPLAYH